MNVRAQDARLRTEVGDLFDRLRTFDWRALQRQPAFASDPPFRRAVMAVRHLVQTFCRVEPAAVVALSSEAIRGLVDAARAATELCDQLTAAAAAGEGPGQDLRGLAERTEELAETVDGRLSQAFEREAPGEAPAGDPGPRPDGAARPSPGDRPTDRSIAEQLGMHEVEIARRKELLGFTAADTELLQRSQSLVLDEVDVVVEEFYRHLVSIDEVALIIGDRETLRHLKSVQRTYVIELFSGFYDEAYVTNRLRVGLVHRRIGVEPKYFLTAMRKLHELLHSVLDEGIEDRAEFFATVEALDKLLDFDTQLVIDTYIHTAMAKLQAAKDEAVRYARNLEQKVAERTQELARLSCTDFLTGLLNRRAFREALHKEVASARRWKSPLTLVYFDLDGFKAINDSEGHRRGDELLRALGRDIAALKREVDVACRLGGDEFCVALPNTDVAGAQTFANRLSSRLLGRSGVAMSVGIVQAGPLEFPSAEELLEQADGAMYEQKRGRRQDAASARGAAGAADRPEGLAAGAEAEPG